MNYFPPSNTKANWGIPIRNQRYAYYKGWWLYTTNRNGVWKASIWQTVLNGVKNQKSRSRFKDESTAIIWCEKQADDIQ